VGRRGPLGNQFITIFGCRVTEAAREPDIGKFARTDLWIRSDGAGKVPVDSNAETLKIATETRTTRSM
jgi:hypothetical protein